MKAPFKHFGAGHRIHVVSLDAEELYRQDNELTKYRRF
jgi:hypothetical protein